jgi:hypothetical protein
MYILFYFSVYKYPNQLRNPESIVYMLIYYLIHLISIFLFLSAGRNPGFVDETETPQSRREKAKLFVNGQYDEFRDVKDSSSTIDLESNRDTTPSE